MSARRTAAACIAAFLAASIAGCIGMPPKAKPVALPEAPLAEFAGGGDWPAREWWKRYGAADLDRLVDMALENSPTLAAAHARFDSAQQSVRLMRAEAGAHVDANGQASRQRLSDNGLFPPKFLGFNWYNLDDLGLQAGYTFDWWGKQKAAVDAAIDQAHAAQADRSAAALILASSVADTYFGWQADQGRLALAREHESMVIREGLIAAARSRADLDSTAGMREADASLAAVRGQIAELAGSANLRIVTLAALAGRPATELPALTAQPLPAISKGLPDDVRLDLIARRADLAASLWRVEAAAKNREAARAEFFPDVSINALIGVESRDIGKLLRYGSGVPNVAAAVHLPIFEGGRLQARYGAAQSAIDEAVAGYRDTLVAAAREVATQATSRAQLEAQRTQRLIALDAVQRLTWGAAARVRQGIVDSRVELTASESWIEQRDQLLQLDAAALACDIGLQRALGGGYARDTTKP